MYSGTIRVKWTSDDESQCVPVRLTGDEGVENVIRRRNDTDNELEMEAAFPRSCPCLQGLFGRSRFKNGPYRYAFGR